MVRNTVARRALNVNGRAVMIVWTALFVPFFMYITILIALEAYRRSSLVG